jgi:UDP-glucose:(heptosyl)LPS alpha-1,3-glucosyltransferase
VRIAIVRKKYTFHGGAEGFSQSLITQLSRCGHEIHIFAIQWELSSSLPNVFFHKVRAVTFNSVLRDVSFALLSSRLLKRESFDVIQSHDKTLYQDICRAGDGCHIEWLRQRWKRAGLAEKASIVVNPYHWLILALERTIFLQHRFRKVIAISEFVKKSLIEHYHVPEEDIRVIYNGVDLEKFHPRNRERHRSRIRRHYAIPDDAFVILFVGSGFERKGLRYLLQAVDLIAKPVTVIVAGKGAARKYAGFSGRQRVIFCGPQPEVSSYYAASDLFVLPTIYEPFGNVHLEALASGLPVITTKLSGASEIITDGIQGYVVEVPDRYRELAEKIELVIGNTDLREAMGLQARKRAEEFSFGRYIDEVMRLYREVSLREGGAASEPLQ